MRTSGHTGTCKLDVTLMRQPLVCRWLLVEEGWKILRGVQPQCPLHASCSSVLRMIVVMPVCLAQPCGARRVPVFFFSVAMLVCDGDGMSDLLPEPAKKKPKAAARRLQQKPDPEEGRGYPMADLEVKRCQGCKKKLPLEEFHQSHSKCKFCFNAFRSIKGMANRQGEAEWFKGLTEGELCDLLKAYGKSHDQAMREKAKIKFSSYRESVQAQAGTRLEGRKRLMSEGAGFPEKKLRLNFGSFNARETIS